MLTEAAAPAGTREILRRVALFEELDESQLDEILGLAEDRHLAPGERFIHEDGPADYFYVILDGTVAVTKRTPDGDSEHEIATLDGPAVVGEFAMFDRKPRSSSVSAKGPAHLLAISIDALRARTEIVSGILESNARHGTALLRRNNEGMVSALQARLEEARVRVALGVFFVYLMVGMAIYTISLRSADAIKDTLPGGTRGLSVAILIVFGMVALAAIRNSGFSWAFYGLTTQGWRKAVWEGVIFSFPMMAFITALKFWGLTTFPELFPTARLFDARASFGEDGYGFAWGAYFLAMTAYVVTVPMQEIICRGCLQSALQKFLVGPRWRVVLTAVITSNLIFAMAHSHLRLSFVLAVTIPGLFWGWMFARHQTLLGVVVSHILIGVWAMFVLGTSKMI